MISGELLIPDDVQKALQGLTEKDVRTLLRKAINEGNKSGGVMDTHFQKGQQDWPELSESYQKKKGANKPKFVNTGKAREAMLNPKSKARRTSVTRSKKTGQYRATVGLRKMVDGRNVYTIVQRGKFGGLDVKARYTGRTKRYSAGDVHAGKAKVKGSQGISRVSLNPMPVSANLPGDEGIIGPHVVKAITDALKRKGML